jgi:diguanylate cyclase (GGDEF)-like protein
MLRPVCDVFNWPLHGSRVGISWTDGSGIHSVGTDIPARLASEDANDDSPWAKCRREARPQRALDLSALDPERRDLAARNGLGAYWVEPVLDDEATVCAVVTVWMRAGGPVPDLHALGMSMAKDYVELIIRWRRQRRRLLDAAHRDSLTGLANRTAFLESLATDQGGAVLYCDLDRFKAVNDRLGHVAGDELLRAVAGRIKACVRADDVVARIGGDEFAVHCVDVTDGEALALAERIHDAVVEPFRVLGSTAQVGISVGVAQSTDGFGDHLLEAADRALYEAKARGGGAVSSND